MSWQGISQPGRDVTLPPPTATFLSPFSVNFSCTQSNESKQNDPLGYIWGWGAGLWGGSWCVAQSCAGCAGHSVLLSRLPQASWLLLFPLCWVFHEEQLWPQVLAQVLQHPLLAAAGKAGMLSWCVGCVDRWDLLPLWGLSLVFGVSFAVKGSWGHSCFH